jgi:integrase
MVRLVPSNRFLIDAAYAPSTLKKYKTAVIDFLKWSFNNKENPADMEELDDVLTEYLHHLYLTHGGKGKAHDTYFGLLMYLRHARGQLPNSELTLRGWNKKHPAKSYPPLTWSLSVAIGVQMVRRGEWRHAVGTLLAFDCFLRVGELVGLKREDVADTNDLRIGAEFKGMALRLRKTKTGPNQWVEVEDNAVKELLRGIIKDTKPKAYLFPFSTSSFVDRSSCRVRSWV